MKQNIYSFPRSQVVLGNAFSAFGSRRAPRDGAFLPMVAAAVPSGGAFSRAVAVALHVTVLSLALIPFAPAQTNAPSAPPAGLEPATTSPTQAAPPQTDPFNDPLIKQIQARVDKAVAGDTKETKSLTTDLEKWTKEQPNNHLLQVYLGSVYTLDSRDAWPGPGKLTYLKNGGKEMDAAVGAEPDNPAVRFVRAINYYELPTFFGKRPTARDDFVVLVKQVEGVIQTPFTLNVETQQAIYYYAGLCYKQLSQPADAKDAWQRGLKLDPASKLGVKIQAELAKMK
jgi:hypothetical protein